MDTLFDILFVAIIIVCGWAGYKKGLIMGIGGVLVIIVSIYGANLLSHTFSYDVIPALRPFVSGYMDTTYRNSVYKQLDIEIPEEEEDDKEDEEGEDSDYVFYDQNIQEDDRLIYSLNDLIEMNPEIEEDVYIVGYRDIGISEQTAKRMAADVLERRELDETEDRYDSYVEVLCQKLSFVAGFILIFLLILILLTVVANLPNLSYKIPGADIVNDIAGAVLGLVTGFMFCIILTWVLKFTGIVIGADTLDNTVFVKWFVNRDILGAILEL